jgi:hypothetical protein
VVVTVVTMMSAMMSAMMPATMMPATMMPATVMPAAVMAPPVSTAVAPLGLSGNRHGQEQAQSQAHGSDRLADGASHDRSPFVLDSSIRCCLFFRPSK